MKTLLHQVLKWTYYIALFVLALAFIGQAVDIWTKFSQGRTSISITREQVDQLQLPAITFCPVQAFKVGAQVGKIRV